MLQRRNRTGRCWRTRIIHAYITFLLLWSVPYGILLWTYSPWFELNKTHSASINLFSFERDSIAFEYPINTEIEEIMDDCNLTVLERNTFPNCGTKIKFMERMWRSNPCYQSYGVNGSLCSIVRYLSEIEGVCPLKHWQQAIPRPDEELLNVTYAFPTTDLDKLMRMLRNPGQRGNYDFIRMRISRVWPTWKGAITDLGRTQNLEGRTRKRILLFLGFISRQAGMGFVEEQFKGGPLGELVQWSDLISALYILGHQLVVISEVHDLLQWATPIRISHCASRTKLPFDLIYTDIIGLHYIEKIFDTTYDKIRCLLRVLDSFGTEPAYNNKAYAKEHKKPNNLWCGLNLQPQQFYTMLPHTPDNSFMGFLVEQHANDVNNTLFRNITRKNQAVVYGKDISMWKGKKPYLDVISKYIDIHSTVYGVSDVIHKHIIKGGLKKGQNPHNITNYVHNDSMVKENGLRRPLKYVPEDEEIPNYVHKRSLLEANARHIHPKYGSIDELFPKYVHNHGLLKGDDLHHLLLESKVFVGLGFPYDGPAPLEAIANGCVFINPRSTPPRPYSGGKPTGRLMSSQHSYAEQFIPEPYVYTINIDNQTEVEETMRKIMTQQQFTPYLPYEFTAKGMIQRINAYIEHQNFCHLPKTTTKWPPMRAMKFLLGPVNTSCKDVCWYKDLVCEPSYFRDINFNSSITHKGVTCNTVRTLSDVYYPAYNVSSTQCILQEDPMLFSCAGQSPRLRRLCPCRNYIKEQVALCRQCIR